MLANRSLSSAPLSSGALQAAPAQTKEMASFTDADAFTDLAANYTLVIAAYSNPDSFTDFVANVTISLDEFVDADSFEKFQANENYVFNLFVDPDSFEDFTTNYVQAMDEFTDVDFLGQIFWRQNDGDGVGPAIPGRGIHEPSPAKRKQQEQQRDLERLLAELEATLQQERNAAFESAALAQRELARIMAEQQQIRIKNAADLLSRRRHDDEEAIAMLLLS